MVFLRYECIREECFLPKGVSSASASGIFCKVLFYLRMSTGLNAILFEEFCFERFLFGLLSCTVYSNSSFSFSELLKSFISSDWFSRELFLVLLASLSSKIEFCVEKLVVSFWKYEILWFNTSLRCRRRQSENFHSAGNSVKDGLLEIFEILKSSKLIEVILLWLWRRIAMSTCRLDYLKQFLISRFSDN